ncbi:MAG: hypothetical protein ACFFAQ_04335 [Promethearchaeota archaeon]
MNHLNKKLLTVFFIEVFNMDNFKKIEENVRFPEVTGNFIVVYEDQDIYLYGWIALDQTLNTFLSFLQKEIEYSWGPEYADINDYLLFHIDTTDKNKLKEISNNEYYQFVRKQDEIFIVILHKKIKYRIIENIPPVFNWFMEDFSNI